MSDHNPRPESLRSARVWTTGGFLLGVVLSVAANIAATWHPSDDVLAKHQTTAQEWSPTITAQVAAAAFPLLLLFTVEILSRVPWPSTFSWSLARFGGTGTVALVAAIVSYGHMYDLLVALGEPESRAVIAPLAVDGLMVVAGYGLLAISKAARAGTATVADTPADTADTGADKITRQADKIASVRPNASRPPISGEDSTSGADKITRQADTSGRTVRTPAAAPLTMSGPTVNGAGRPGGQDPAPAKPQAMGADSPAGQDPADSPAREDDRLPLVPSARPHSGGNGVRAAADTSADTGADTPARQADKPGKNVRTPAAGATDTAGGRPRKTSAPTISSAVNDLVRQGVTDPAVIADRLRNVVGREVPRSTVERTLRRQRAAQTDEKAGGYL